jgi:hypothetical protein
MNRRRMTPATKCKNSACSSGTSGSCPNGTCMSANGKSCRCATAAENASGQCPEANAYYGCNNYTRVENFGVASETPTSVTLPVAKRTWVGKQGANSTNAYAKTVSARNINLLENLRSGTSASRSDWLTAITGSNAGKNEQLEYVSPTAVTKDGTSLLITATKQSIGGQQFLSGQVETADLFTPGTLFTVEYEYDSFYPGLWPAIWFAGDKTSHKARTTVDDNWPQKGEFDLLEHGGKLAKEANDPFGIVGTSPKYFSTVHCNHLLGNGTYNYFSNSVDCTSGGCSVIKGSNGLDGDMYTNSVNKLAIYWDERGTKLYTWQWDITKGDWLLVGCRDMNSGILQCTSETFTEPKHLIINLAVGGHLGGGTTAADELVANYSNNPWTLKINSADMYSATDGTVKCTLHTACGTGEVCCPGTGLQCGDKCVPQGDAVNFPLKWNGCAGGTAADFPVNWANGVNRGPLVGGIGSADQTPDPFQNDQYYARHCDVQGYFAAGGSDIGASQIPKCRPGTVCKLGDPNDITTDFCCPTWADDVACQTIYQNSLDYSGSGTSHQATLKDVLKPAGDFHEYPRWAVWGCTPGWKDPFQSGGWAQCCGSNVPCLKNWNGSDYSYMCVTPAECAAQGGTGAVNRADLAPAVYSCNNVRIQSCEDWDGTDADNACSGMCLNGYKCAWSPGGGTAGHPSECYTTDTACTGLGTTPSLANCT